MKPARRSPRRIPKKLSTWSRPRLRRSTQSTTFFAGYRMHEVTRSPAPILDTNLNLSVTRPVAGYLRPLGGFYEARPGPRREPPATHARTRDLHHFRSAGYRDCW